MVSSLNLKRYCVLGLVALLTIFIYGCGKQKSSYDLLSEAQQYHKKGQDNAAVIELKNALQKDPKNGEARYLFALIHIERGEGAAAEIELHKALDLGVNKDKISAALGKALLLQQEYKKVLDSIQPSEGYTGKLAADIYIVRGDAYIGLGKMSEAKSSFDTALKKYPGSADARLGLARLAALQNNFDEALRQIDIGLSKDSKNTKVLLMKASILRMDDDKKGAKAVYHQILGLNKRNISARLGLASLGFADDDIDAARVQIEAANKIEPKNLQIKYMQAILHYREKKYADTRDELQEVMKVMPDYMPGVLLSAAVFYQLGSYEQAHQYLLRFLAQVPDDEYATNLLIATDLQINQPDEALKYLGKLLKKSPNKPEVLALAGETYMQTKDYAKATEYLEKASAIDPKNAALKIQLGASHLGSGEARQAIHDLETAVAMDSSQTKADALLVVTYLNKGDYDKAISIANAWEKKQPKNPIVYFLQGRSYAGKNDVTKARDNFEKALDIQPDYFPAVLNLAQLDLIGKDPQEAKQRLEVFLQHNKSNMRAMVAIAEIAASQKQGKEYVDWLRKASTAEPDALLPHAKLADYFLANGDREEALRVARDAVNSNPNNPAALDLLGATQLALKDAKGALATYDKLVKIAPNVPISYLRLALAQLMEGKPEDARTSLTKALELKPDFIQAMDAMVRLDLLENKGDEALKLTRELQARQPKSPLGYDREADILMLQKHYAQAVKSYEEALTRGGGSAVMIKLHRAMISAGDTKAADQRLKSWIDRNQNDTALRDYAAGYYMANNLDKKAINQYEELLKLKPDNPIYLNNLANLYLREQDPRALSTAERAQKFAPENPSVLDTVGWILVKQDKPKSAIEILRKALSNAPYAGGIRYHLAVALAHSGNTMEAKKELQKAIDTGGKFPELADAKLMLKNL